MSRFKILLALLAMLCFPHFAKAACNTSTYYGGPNVPPPEIAFTASGVPSSFDPSLAVGTTLFTASLNAPSTNSYYYCPSLGGTMTLLWAGVVGTVISGPAVSGIYPTTIDGIGMTIAETSCAPTSNWPTSFAGAANPGSMLVGGRCPIAVKFIKTGPITHGGTLAGIFGGVYSQAGDPLFYLTFGGGGIPITPTLPSCVVAPPTTITVPLAPATVGSFSGVGTVGGNLNNFNIVLNCSGGSAGTSVNTNVTLSDATNPSNATDMLTPSTGSTAAGVGIRIFTGSTSVTYGPTPTVLGQTKVSAGTSQVTIPLTAQYVQIAPTVGPGDVKAIAYINIGYN